MKSDTNPITIPEDIAAKCIGPNQFQNFDLQVSGLMAVPKSAIVKEEKKWKWKQARRRAMK